MLQTLAVFVAFGILVAPALTPKHLQVRSNVALDAQQRTTVDLEVRAAREHGVPRGDVGVAPHSLDRARFGKGACAGDGDQRVDRLAHQLGGVATFPTHARPGCVVHSVSCYRHVVNLASGGLARPLAASREWPLPPALLLCSDERSVPVESPPFRRIALPERQQPVRAGLCGVPATWNRRRLAAIAHA